MKKKNPGVVLKGIELFDANLFKDERKTKSFYHFMAELKTLVSSAIPTPTHEFLRQLQEAGHILRLYTQYIDDLEASIDLPVVQLHGTMKNVRCTLCSASYLFTKEYQNTYRKGRAPLCPNCKTIGDERALLGKRQLAVGTLRPNIVLYNEEHPDAETIGELQSSDIKRKPDLLIVLGTSLRIPALKRFIKLAAKTIHESSQGCTILVNKTPPTKEWERVFDYFIEGDSDEWADRMKEKLKDNALISAAWRRIQDRIKKKEEDEEEEDEEEEKENTRRRRTRKMNEPDECHKSLRQFKVIKRPKLTRSPVKAK